MRRLLLPNVLLGFGVLFTAIRPAVAKDDPRWSIGPVPAWVQTIDAPAEAPAPSADVSSGIQYLLADRQVAVVAATVSRYRHWTRKILATSGLEDGSEVRIEFDPSYQRLFIHDIRLLRRGQRIGSFDANDVQIIHNESDLDQRIYNGSLTAVVFLKDVRPGDVVDFAYTLEGQNPILQGRLVDHLELAYSMPVSRIRHRVLFPRSRTLYYKGHHTVLAPRITEGDSRIYEWEQRDVPALLSEEDVPGWFETAPWIQLTEFATWGEVARWASDLFAAPGPPAAELRQLAAPWQTAGSEEAKARAAVRMVQDEVRYLGIEIGPNSHQPHPPLQVLSQRFGDCKDKALLLATLLRELGIEARPALVNTRVEHGLDEWLPTPFAFDHAIVFATVGGKPLWIDATQSEQGGPLTAVEPPAFERALLVQSDTDRLVPIPTPVAPDATSIVEETFTLPTTAHPGQLRVESTYRGRDADAMRVELDSMSQSERARKYLNFYAQRDATIRASRPPRIKDDRDLNVITVMEDYEIPDFWDHAVRDFHAWTIADELRRPATRLRAAPIQIRHPTHVRYRLRLASELLPPEMPRDTTIERPAFQFTVRSERAGQVASVLYDYRTKASSVAPGDIRAYLDGLDEIDQQLGYRIERGTLALSPTANDDHGVRVFAVVGGLLGVGITAWATVAGVGSWRRSRRRAAFARAVRFESGHAPYTALRVADQEELDLCLRTIGCACGRPLAGLGERTECRYDGRLMTVVARECPGCTHTQTLYFDVAAAVDRRGQ